MYSDPSLHSWEPLIRASPSKGQNQSRPMVRRLEKAGPEGESTCASCQEEMASTPPGEGNAQADGVAL